MFKLDPSKASQIPETTPSSAVTVIETKPMLETAAPQLEIKPTKPVSKPTKQLSSVVRVVSANPVASSTTSSFLSVNENNAPKSAISKVQIVSSHIEANNESKKSPPTSVVHVEAIDGAAILPSKVEVIGGISSSESYVDN